MKSRTVPTKKDEKKRLEKEELLSIDEAVIRGSELWCSHILVAVEEPAQTGVEPGPKQ